MDDGLGGGSVRGLVVVVVVVVVVAAESDAEVFCLSEELQSQPIELERV